MHPVCLYNNLLLVIAHSYQTIIVEMEVYWHHHNCWVPFMYHEDSSEMHWLLLVVSHCEITKS